MLIECRMFQCFDVPMFQWSNVPMCFSFHRFARFSSPLVHWSIGQFWIGGLIWLTLFDEIFEKNPKSHSCKFYEIFYQNMISHSSRFGETLNPWWHSFGSYVTRIQFLFLFTKPTWRQDKQQIISQKNRTWDIQWWFRII